MRNEVIGQYQQADLHNVVTGYTHSLLCNNAQKYEDLIYSDDVDVVQR